MGSITISFLPPTNLHGYNRALEPQKQPSNIPPPFKDAMAIREEVFVKEFNIPLENEFDEDDTRSCHWVAYEAGIPVGTIRLVPFPQKLHPVTGGIYIGGKLASGPLDKGKAGLAHSDDADRATDLHDGAEPYIKLGRLSVPKQFRSKGIAGLLVKAAVEWAEHNPGYFNNQTGGREVSWKGLLCVHARAEMAKVWARWGFVADLKMGEWVEEGLGHITMFRRVEVKANDVE